MQENSNIPLQDYLKKDPDESEGEFESDSKLPAGIKIEPDEDEIPNYEPDSELHIFKEEPEEMEIEAAPKRYLTKINLLNLNKDEQIK